MIAESPHEITTQVPALATPDDREIVISVRDVGKMYRIYEKPQDRLKQMLFWRFGKNYGHEFWAVRHVSFDIRRGETVGIIGRNGSGKSTLLQMIAGTLAPTEGEVVVRGRVAALLELGSGFNPEFTGRENVFLNGAILGLSREEMAARFDEIAAFADIGEFIEQPVKTYSSGMVVRLAFAVQAFVPKDVLIVDEALAVGDMFFQAKCMARMKRMLDDGVTVMFVSHDTGAVKSLCRRALLIGHGSLQQDSSADRVIEHYFALRVRGEQSTITATEPQPNTHGSHPHDDLFRPEPAFEKRAAFQRIQNGKARFSTVQLLDQAGHTTVNVAYNDKIVLRMAVEVCVDIPGELAFGYHIRDNNGVDIVYSDSLIEHAKLIDVRAGQRFVIDWAFQTALQQGAYTVAVVLSIPLNIDQAQVDFCDFIPVAVQFNVERRQESRLYGAVHWDNVVSIEQYDR